MGLSHNPLSQVTSLLTFGTEHNQRQEMFFCLQCKAGYFWPFAIFPRTFSFYGYFTLSFPTVGLKLNIQKTKIMASSPITSWEIDGETVETVSDFTFLGSKITADGDGSHEIKRRLLLGSKVMTNLDSIFKSRDITLPTKVRLARLWFFLWSYMDVRVGL